MLRILFDEGGDGHSDLFVKVDTLVSSCYVVDSYFLHTLYPGVSKEEVLRAFLKDLQQRFAALKPDEIGFIPFGYFDESLEGFLVKRRNGNLIQLKVESTELFSALNYNHDAVLREFQMNGNALLSENSTLISGEAVAAGLEWSIQRIKWLEKKPLDGI